ncbi:hypothetical protein K435DRAFT_669175, partial [Dendrothele bispora CBS 962.96]
MPRQHFSPSRRQPHHLSFRSISTTSRLSSDPSLSFPINPALPDSVKDALAGAVKPDTQIRHQRAVKEFLTWADSKSLLADEVLPATEATLLEYAATFSGRLAGGTVRAKISALKTWHTSHGHAWQGGDLLRKVLTGVERKAPASSHRPERPGVSEGMMNILHSAFSHSNRGLHHASNTGSKVAFLGQMRLGEL